MSAMATKPSNCGGVNWWNGLNEDGDPLTPHLHSLRSERGNSNYNTGKIEKKTKQDAPPSPQ